MASYPDDKARDPAASLHDEIAVDRHAEVPIGVQIAWALRSRIADGRLPSGSRLPTLRELAETTGVNVNTIRAVYQRLEQERLIESRQGSGTFVSEHGERVTVVGSIAALAASEAQSQGVDPRSVAAALYSASSAAGTPADEALARRHSLRAQIATLERAVTELESRHPTLAAAKRRQAPGSGPVLLDSATLEEVRAQLLRRLVALQAAIDEDAIAAQGARASGVAPGRSPARHLRAARAGAQAGAAKPGKAPAQAGVTKPGR
ncbi:MAG: GntR family transcriptional regulator, partial [Solirubrobacteraceae bacterium]